ncbi:hypothetical protein Tco_1053082 [Tanacetum coccineum]
MVVIWNPTVRKSVAIVMPSSKVGYNVVSFGVCPDTSDPKLVKINVDRISSMWVVEVFTLSTRVWKTVFTGAPFKSCYLSSVDQVFVNGVIYFHAYDDINLDWGDRSKSYMETLLLAMSQILSFINNDDGAILQGVEIKLQVVHWLVSLMYLYRDLVDMNDCCSRTSWQSSRFYTSVLDFDLQRSSLVLLPGVKVVESTMSDMC